MEAGITPEDFWSMMPVEMRGVLDGYQKRARMQAVQAHLIGAFVCEGVGAAITNAFRGSGSAHYPTVQEAFPGMFPELEATQKPAWRVAKERILAHRDDYLKRGESA